jgi:Rps23 Pro-64 3,4-dihydroxylase Tpa1-like proline 4-hydroxylase/peroxiredoxin
MQYSIWIVNSWHNAQGHTRCFEEVALALQSAFRELGYDVPIVRSHEEARGRVIVLGAGVLHRHDIKLPEDMIIYNFEQVHEQARFFLPGNPYINYLRRYPVWDYSQNNIAELAKRGVTNVAMCGVGYMPELTRIPKNDLQDIDVLFIGSMHPRRQQLIDELKERGLRVEVIQDMYGPQRDAVIARSKVILNVHLQPANVFEVVRVSYMLANRKCVVSEVGDDKQLEGPYEKAVVFRPYGQLVKACLEYASNAEKRIKQEEAGFNIFSKMSQVPMLAAALKHDAGKSATAVPEVLTVPAIQVDIQPPAKKSQSVAKQKRIFVNIASYRDTETDPTVRNLFEMADYPDRVFFGICLQIDPVKDSLCTVHSERPWQVRIQQVHYKDSRGANWARAQAQKLWQDEDYVLQIDSHMRVAKGWDTTMIEMLESCPSEKPVLSTYVSRYTPPNTLYESGEQILRIRVQEFGADDRPQILHLTKIPLPYNKPYADERSGLYPSPFYIANFMFCRAETLQQVPFDPYIKFWGDEITYSARLWTHGFDIYQPNHYVIWHYWRRDELVSIQPYRRADGPDAMRVMARIKHLLGLKKCADTIALTEIEQYGLGDERSLDDLWKFAGLDWQKRTITDDALEGRWNMAAREKYVKSNKKPTKAPSAKSTSTKKTATAKSTATKLPRIFVQIASYRDPDCQWTVKDLFEKATHPERIFVGICWQFVEKEDKICFEQPYPYPEQVRVLEVDAKKSKGVCWARNQAQKLLKDEEFTLQIDSHMRFEPGWDDTLIEMYNNLPTKKSVLTCYAPGFTPPNDCDRRWLFGMGAKHFDTHDILLMAGKPAFGEKNLPKEPIAGAFVSANMLFGPASIIKDVPYDPNLYFFGEEISLSVRIWTHGYDIYHPNKIVIFHDWDRGKRKTHFDDHRDWTVQNEESFKRVRHLLGTTPSLDPKISKDLDIYGLGAARSLAEYQSFSGIDFASRTISDFALQGVFDNRPKSAEVSRANDKKTDKTAKTSTNEVIRHQGGSGQHSKIFVQITSYRDPDCQWTVKDLFEKATHPERINVGICWQFNKQEDADCFKQPYPRPEQVRVIEFTAVESKGACWARANVQQLWQGEEFTLQIDSHMRFEKGWDETLVQMWSRLDSPKSVLTCYAPGFKPPDVYESNWIFGIAAKQFDAKNKVLHMVGRPAFKQGDFPAKPIQGAFVSAHMLFGPSSIIQDVPADPNLYFFGHEISLAVRLWTHGYDIYHPNKAVIYHNWDRSYRKTHFADHIDWAQRNDLSYARIRHLLGTEKSNDTAITKDIDKFGLGQERTLQEYENYSGVNFSKQVIQQKALDGKFTPKKAPDASGKDWNITKPGAIFINIASYRDPECQWTVKDLFEKANNPDRVFVGICWQFDQEEDKHCFEVVTRPDQVRIMPVDWREAEGVCWARYQTQLLWDGEEYTLMIDSHMRFVPGWDDLMIQELAACDSPKPVLSCSPTPYWPPNKLGKNMNPTIRRVKPFFPDGNLRCQGEALDRMPEKPLNAAFMVANFCFSRSEIIKEVPYDPYLYFDQEEITYAARLYTHGWDIFSSRRQFLYHYYNDIKVPGGSVRPLHWRDLRQADETRIRFLRDRGLMRFNHMTGYKISYDSEVIRELDKYGWGNVRTLQQFEEYSGVDFKNKVTTERALRCHFIKDLHKYRDKPIFVPEVDQQKNTAMQAGNVVLQQGVRAVNAAPIQASQLHTTQVITDGAPAQNTNPPKLPVSLVSIQNNPSEAQEIQKLAPVTLLEPCDFIPFFHVHDTNNKVRAIETYGGRHVMLFFLPADNLEFLNNFFRHMQNNLSDDKRLEAWQLFILDAPIEKLLVVKEKLRLPHVLMSDADLKISRSLGVAQPGDTTLRPTGFVLDRNLKIISRHVSDEPSRLAIQCVEDCREAMHRFQEKYRDRKVISEVAPALIVPNTFTPEFCAKCINSFRTGHTFEGTVGAEDTRAYRPNAKKRIDHVPRAQLVAEIDDKLSRSLFPEIKKIFGFDVTHRELYKIGLYNGENQGFFKQHRDNFDAPLGYRRIAATVHLSDNYEGGGLRFPEYDDNIYRPTLGSAVAFSCSTLHEALPVTKGERFVLVCFFHDREGEEYRKHYVISKGAPMHLREFTPTLRQYPDLRLSRAFYDDWRTENLSFNKRSVNEPKSVHAVPVENQPTSSASNQSQENDPYGFNNHADQTLHQKNATSQCAVEIKENIMQTSNSTQSAGASADHKPKKVYESKECIIFDDFLSEENFNVVYDFVMRCDYERINTTKTSRAWHVHDGFPLRSTLNAFYYADPESRPDAAYAYPTKTPFDLFIDTIRNTQPLVGHLSGREAQDWWHFSVTAWLYPHGTALSLHDDGSGVYAGAYVYFLNPEWRPHWGGQLIVLDGEANNMIRKYSEEMGGMDFYKSKWLHANRMDEIAMEHGFGKCVFPKKNRIVFIANDAYHMVTRVNEQSGDNLRTSLAGFFNRKKK